MDEHGTNSCRVALVDDQPLFRRLLQLLLEDEPGIDLVGEAADGAAAIELARAVRPDVLLLDIAMPVLDGLQALPGILEASPRTRVVMLTGFADGKLRERAFEAGASAWLEKGADAAAITAAVRAGC